MIASWWSSLKIRGDNMCYNSSDVLSRHTSAIFLYFLHHINIKNIGFLFLREYIMSHGGNQWGKKTFGEFTSMVGIIITIILILSLKRLFTYCRHFVKMALHLSVMRLDISFFLKLQFEWNRLTLSRLFGREWEEGGTIVTGEKGERPGMKEKVVSGLEE